MTQPQRIAYHDPYPQLIDKIFSDTKKIYTSQYSFIAIIVTYVFIPNLIIFTIFFTFSLSFLIYKSSFTQWEWADALIAVKETFSWIISLSISINNVAIIFTGLVTTVAFAVTALINFLGTDIDRNRLTDMGDMTVPISLSIIQAMSKVLARLRVIVPISVIIIAINVSYTRIYQTETPLKMFEKTMGLLFTAALAILLIYFYVVITNIFLNILRLSPVGLFVRYSTIKSLKKKTHDIMQELLRSTPQLNFLGKKIPPAAQNPQQLHRTHLIVFYTYLILGDIVISMCGLGILYLTELIASKYTNIAFTGIAHPPLISSLGLVAVPTLGVLIMHYLHPYFNTKYGVDLYIKYWWLILVSKFTKTTLNITCIGTIVIFIIFYTLGYGFSITALAHHCQKLHRFFLQIFTSDYFSYKASGIFVLIFSFFYAFYLRTQRKYKNLIADKLTDHIVHIEKELDSSIDSLLAEIKGSKLYSTVVTVDTEIL